jgi:flavin reductase (DIM6/NTAB) family NADH-FMN oxidoreductase RutF
MNKKISSNPPIPMIHHNLTKLESWPSRKKAHYINSIVGFKPVHLIGTHHEGWSNLSIVSTLTHLGSNPALIGFVLRPTTVPRHTYDLMKKNPYFTINNISESMLERAHQCSAKYEEGESEFEAVGFEEDWKGFKKAPYVTESPIQMGCEWINEWPIEENGCRFLVAKIHEVFIDSNLMTEDSDGFIRLDSADILCASGMDAYYKAQFLYRRNYAQPDVEPHTL